MSGKIQILSLRTFTTEDGRLVKHDRKHFKAGWRADSVQELFENMDSFIDKIPEKERWNIYYTASRCLEEKGRKFVDQQIIPIDIDHIDATQVDRYVSLIGRVLEIDLTKVGIVFSGNGLQFIILLKHPFDRLSYFETNKAYYKAMCGKINTAMMEEGLIGECDPVVFSGGRLLRMPFTENRKDSGRTQAKLINGNLENIDFNMTRVSGLPELMESDRLDITAFNRMAKPDSVAVQEECGFLKHCKENQEDVSEPEWYAMLSIIGRLDDGTRLAHEYSEKHTAYSPDETDRKMSQSLEAAGPRTCSNIASMYSGCETCPHYREISSPIQIRGANYIKTKDTGFWEVVITKQGDVKRTNPSYDDLVTWYDLAHPHITLKETGLVYKFTGKHWEHQEPVSINNFVEVNMEPKPLSAHCREFYEKMKRTNIKDTMWMLEEGKINLSNGVLDVETREFTTHSRDYGFPYVLPYNYDPSAECPRWEKFIDEVTLGRKELIYVLQEVMGMCIMYVDPKLIQRCAILIGAGSNGKTVYLDILKKLLGAENFSVTSIAEAAKTPNRRMAMMNKMANITEETPGNTLMESSFFKDVVSGGDIEAHKMYHGAVKYKNMAKLVMACNEMPRVTDSSNGLRRRLLIIPFDRIFLRKEQDPLLTRKLSKEIEGIFNWALVGAVRLSEQSFQFSDGDIIEELTATHMVEGLDIYDWVIENAELDASDPEGTSVRDLCDNYAACSFVRKSDREFVKSLKMYIQNKLGIPNLDTKVKKVDGSAMRVMPYIRLKEGNNARV